MATKKTTTTKTMKTTTRRKTVKPAARGGVAYKIEAVSPKRDESGGEPIRTNVIGDAKERLKGRIEAYCQIPRHYAEIVHHSRVTDSQTRYLLRALMYANRIVKSGSRENTVYVVARAARRKVA